MKICKKALSVLLAVCMLLSVMTVGLTVFAADKSTAVTNLEAKIQAFEGNLNVAETTEEALAGYNELTAAFKALSQDEKESMDVLLFDVLYHHVIDRERQLSIKNNTSVPSYNKQHYINAANAVPTALGSVPAYLEAAKNLAVTLADKNVSIDDKKTAYSEASPAARIMSGGYYASYDMFYYALKGDAYKGANLIVDKIQAALLVENPVPAKPARPGTAPKPGSYENGENDPQYIADYAVWLEKQKAYSEAYAAEYTHKGNLYLEAMNWLVSVEPEYKAATECMTALRDAKSAYDTGAGGASAKAVAAVKLYDDFSEADLARFNALDATIYGVATPTATGYSYTSMDAEKLYTACVDIGNSKYVDYFVVVIEDMDEPYTRADIEAAKAAYAKVPSTLRGSIPVEILKKYNDVLASISPDEPVGDRPNVEIMESTVVEYPFALSKSCVNNSISNLEDVLFEALGVEGGNLTKMVSEGLYTNYTVAYIAKALFPLLGDLSSLIAKSPTDVAKTLTEDKYAGARAALEAATNTVDGSGAQVSKLDAWQYLTVVDGDFGFNDGDREGFLDATSALFRSLTLLTMVITLENTASTSNGTYTYGAYEELVPVFEVLGVENVMSSPEYTEYVNAGDSSADKMQRRIRAILVPVFDLLDSIAADPMDGILELLPKLAYATTENILNDRINAVISSMSMVSLDPVDLTTGGLFDIIAPMLQNLELKAAQYDEQGNELAPAAALSLSLDKQAFIACFDELAGCGKYVALESVARGRNYFVTIDGDKADAFVVLFRYLHSEIVNAKNITAIKDALSAMNLGTIPTFALNVVVSIVASSSADGALRMIAILLPVVKIVLKVSKLFG